MKFFVSALSFLAASSSLFCISNAAAGEYKSLVISEARYPGKPDISRAETNAHAFATTIEQLGADTEFLQNLNRSEFVQNVIEFSKKSDADGYIFYYTGRVALVDRDLYFLPDDEDITEVKEAAFKGVSLKSLISQFDKTKSKIIFVNGLEKDIALISSINGDDRIDLGGSDANLYFSFSFTSAPPDAEVDDFTTSAIKSLVNAVEPERSQSDAEDPKGTSDNAAYAQSYGHLPTQFLATPQPRLSGDLPPDAAKEYIKRGDDLLNGTGGEKNAAAALRLYIKAADLGNLDRAIQIADIYDTGNGVPVDNDLATNWYMKAGAAGEFYIGRRLQFGPGRPQWQYKAPFYLAGGQMNLAMPWLRKSVEHGYVEAKAYIGQWYEASEDPNEYKIGEKLYTQGAEAGDKQAMIMLAHYYGDETHRDVDKAIYWYKKLVDGGDIYYVTDLADSMLKEAHPDYKQIRSLYEAAIAKNAAVNVIAELKYDYAYFLSNQLPKPEQNKAYDLYLQSANMGNKDAMQTVANYLYNGKFVKQDFIASGMWYERGAAAGNNYANASLAIYYSRGLGVKKDIALSVKLAELAVRKENDAADEMKKYWSNWTLEFRKAFQVRLQDLKLYAGKIDGKTSQELQDAIDKLRRIDYPNYNKPY